MRLSQANLLLSVYQNELRLSQYGRLRIDYGLITQIVRCNRQQDVSQCVSAKTLLPDFRLPQTQRLWS
jgi:hypothetical protein